MRRSAGLRRWRANALLSLVLVVAAVALAHRLSRALLRADVDLSEEQLSQPSPVGLALLRDLEDVLEVRAYFTGEVELAVAQLAKRRLVDQLAEVERLGRGNVAVAFRDPNGSSEARAEAYGLGVVPQTVGARQGTSAISQDLFLGLVLRYRGREEVLPFVLPQSFEYAFLSAVRRLQRESEPVLGLLGGGAFRSTASAGEDLGFDGLRALLAAGREVRLLQELDVTGSIPDDVDAVVVAGPRSLHPRAAFALDQFVQRGGRLALLLDRSVVDPWAGSVTPVETGLEALLDAWGAPLSERIVWDTERANPRNTRERVSVAGAELETRAVRVAYPPWVSVAAEALNPDEVVTARLPGLDLFWAHPLLPPEDSAVPEGVTRVPLASTSSATYAVAPDERVEAIDPAALQARTLALISGRAGRRMPLAAVLRGRFPSPFVGGAPAPFDPVAAARHEAAVAAAREDGLEPPPVPPVGTTDEPVASAAADGLVVVIGDADWVRSAYLGQSPRNRMAVEDLADWLTLEEDLLALRTRRPKERPLRDFLAVAREARGLPAMGPDESVAADDAARLRREEEAASAAARARWAWTLAATGGSALLAALFGLLGRLVLGRARVRPTAAGAGTGDARP